jgi:hypothetical protein
MKGGGVKGLALAGALIELEKYFRFDVFVGTSAGAIGAVLLAAGYSGTDLERQLQGKDFADFLDSWPRKALNLLRGGGLNSGDRLQAWIRELLDRKITQVGGVKLSSLPNRAILYAANERYGLVTFDSRGQNGEQLADFAVRCSLSIPFFFVPLRYNNEPIFDGGLLNNYPVASFLSANPGSDFLALYLSSGPGPKPASTWNPLDLLKLVWTLVNIVTCRDERVVVDANLDKTVVIDVEPIGTMQFGLGRDEKEFLVLSGRKAALEFLVGAGHVNLTKDLTTAIAESHTLKDRILKARRRRRWKYVLGGGGLMLLVAGGLFLAWHYAFASTRLPPVPPAQSPSAEEQQSPVDDLQRRETEGVTKRGGQAVKTGTLVIVAKPWARVMWNGCAGETREAKPLVVPGLSIGEHTFIFDHPAYEVVKKTIPVHEGEQTYRLDLTQEAPTKPRLQ